MMRAPAQTTGCDVGIPGQIIPQKNGPGSTTIRAIGRLSGATMARTAAIAVGQGSPVRPAGTFPPSGTHRTVSLGGVGDGVLVGWVVATEASGVGVGVGFAGVAVAVGFGLAHAARTSIAMATAAKHFTLL